jgi:hypothetical protein
MRLTRLRRAALAALAALTAVAGPACVDTTAPPRGAAAAARGLTAAAEPAPLGAAGAPGRCLDVWGESREPGAEVVIYDCHGGANQRWAPGGDAPAVFVGAGDVASCAWAGDERTAALLDTTPAVVWAAGDLAYPDGTAADFADCYGPSWGRHRARTRPGRATASTTRRAPRPTTPTSATPRGRPAAATTATTSAAGTWCRSTAT